MELRARGHPSQFPLETQRVGPPPIIPPETPSEGAGLGFGFVPLRGLRQKRGAVAGSLGSRSPRREQCPEEPSSNRAFSFPARTELLFSLEIKTGARRN